MTTVVTPGDRLVTLSGRPSWLKRGSSPLSMFTTPSAIELVGERWISYSNLYKSQPWVAIAINKLARQMARLPLKGYERAANGDRERLEAGHLVDLLARPQTRRGPIDLKQAMAYPLLLDGNSTIEMRTSEKGGPITELRPQPWRYMKPLCDSAGRIEGWELLDPDDRRFLGPEQVLHFSWWGPDSDVGVSPLQQLGVTIQAEDAAQRFTASSFKNGIKSSGAFVTPPDVSLDKGEKDRFREEIRQTVQGADNALNFMLLSGGVDFKAFQQTAHEAELIEARKINREEILAVYDVPPPMAGVLDNATYSNIETQHQMLYTDVLGPHMVLLEEQLQAQLLRSHPLYDGQFVEFDFSEVLRGDKIKEIIALRNGLQAGIYTLNEVRRVLNLPRIDHKFADQPLIPVNNLAPLDAIDAGQSEVSDQVDKHMKRVADRVVRKAAAGEEQPFDSDRFQRELRDDVAGALGEKADAFAATWTQIVAAGVNAAADADQLRGFFEAVTTTR